MPIVQHDLAFKKVDLINNYSMKQPDLYYFETIKMTSQILYGEYKPQASILC